jgi:hypothetical protein
MVLLPKGLQALKQVAKAVGLDLKGAYLNLDGGFDSARNRKCIFAVAQKSPCEGNRVIMGKESVLKLGQRGPDARQEVPMRTPQRERSQKNELKPWQKKAWCIPPEQDAAFVCQMEEVLDIYKKPYDAQCPQVCLDEMSTQLLGEVRAPLPAEPGKPLRYDTEYKRNGTANIFIAFEPLVGQRYTTVMEQRTKVDWAHFIQELVDQHYPHVEKICLVMDNLNTHTKASLYEAFDPPEAKRIAEKLDIHYTPKHGSWFNMAEIELSHLSRQCLGGRIAAKATLINKVQAWNTQRNEKHTKAHWQFTTDDARVKLRRLYPIVLT